VERVDHIVKNIQVEGVLVDRGDHIVPNIQVERGSSGKRGPHGVKHTGRWGFLWKGATTGRHTGREGFLCRGAATLCHTYR
jgi:hypothetical protein